MSYKTEEEIRRRIKKKHKERQDFLTHIAIYLMVNGLLWTIWIATGADSHPWPMWSTVFWGLGVVANGFDYYFKYGGGRERFERTVEAEVERELARYNFKRKNDDLFEDTYYDDDEVDQEYGRGSSQ